MFVVVDDVPGVVVAVVGAVVVVAAAAAAAAAVDTAVVNAVVCLKYHTIDVVAAVVARDVFENK